MRNPYIGAIERRMNEKREPEDYVYYDEGGRRVSIRKGEWTGSAHEFELFNSLLKEFQSIDRKFSVPFVSKLLKIAGQCEAGGHKSRGRMLRALAKEFEVNCE